MNKYLLKTTLTGLILSFTFLQGFAQTVTETQLLYPDDGGIDDVTGHAVDINGNYAIITAPYHDDPAENIGAAYIYFNNNGTWELQSKLTPSDGAAFDNFGKAAIITPTHAFVGAPNHDVPAATGGGVYIFENNNGTWTEIEKLSIDSVDLHFGESMSLYGDVLAVSGPGWELNTGAVFMYKLENTSWVQDTMVLATDVVPADGFAANISLFDNYLLAGAILDDDGGTNCGAVYSFFNNNGTWEEHQKILPENGYDYMGFGANVTIDNQTLAVGVPNSNEPVTNAGMIFLYELNEGTWAADTSLHASDYNSGDQFGTTVSLKGDYLATGSPNADVTIINTGQAYLFKRENGVWNEHKKLIASDRAHQDFLGRSTAIAGETILVGASGKTGAAESSGAAYIFSPKPPVIITQPVDQINICMDTTVLFFVETEEIETYQWQQSNDMENWTNIIDDGEFSGAQTDSLYVAISDTLPLVYVRCIISNIDGTIESNIVGASKDSEPPVINCEETFLIQLEEGVTSYTVNGYEFDPPLISDNCSVPTITNDYNNSESLDGEILDLGSYTITWSATDSIGNVSTCTTTIYLNTVGLNEAENHSLKVYPNPGNGVFTIDSNISGNGSIFSTDGKLIQQNRINAGTQNIDLSSFNSGIYVLKVSSEKAVYMKKIIIQ